MALLCPMDLHQQQYSTFKSILRYYFIVITLGLLSNGVLCNDVKVLRVVENSEVPKTIGSLATESNRDTATFFTVINPLLDSEVEGIPGVTLQEVFEFQSGGNVILKRSLDREQKESFNLLVSADGDQFYVVDIKVLDLNDNAPAFSKSERNVTVSELAQVNDQISVLGSAIDRDQGINSTQRYELVSGSNGVFKLEQTQVSLISLLFSKEESFQQTGIFHIDLIYFSVL